MVENMHGGETDVDVGEDVPLISNAQVSHTLVITGSEIPHWPDVDDDACLIVLRASLEASLNAAFSLEALVEYSIAPKAD